jgi:hypothetical protein
MSEETPIADLAIRPQGGAIQNVNPSNPVAAMLQAITEKGITTENAAALEKMADLYLKMEAVNARKSFAEAKRQLQQALPPICANKPVPNNDGTTRYKYAPYEEIMQQVAPFLSKYGFAISFSQRVDENRLVAICTLSHIDGHSEANEFAVRIGKGPPGSSECQADGAASTYAKRFALCNCLNITIEHDDDGKALGDYITREQAENLQRRLEDIGGDVAAFLRFAGARDFSEIRKGKYATVEAALVKKEGQHRDQQAEAELKDHDFSR